MYNVNNNHYDKSSVPHGIHSYSKLWWRMINSCLGQIVFDNIPHKCDTVLRYMYYHRGFEKSLNTKGWAMEYTYVILTFGGAGVLFWPYRFRQYSTQV